MKNSTLPTSLDAKALERFWAKVDKSGECWTWTASKTGDGYGQFWVAGSMQMAHRVSFSLAKGAISNGMFIDHMCHNTSCVNPAHLREATNSQNQQNRAGVQSNSKTGIRGVQWDGTRNRWRAQVFFEGKWVRGKRRADLCDAKSDALQLRLKYFTHSLDSEHLR